MNLRKLRAFTLLELIVTIVILAILAALAIPTFMQVVSKSKLETAEVTVASLGREALALRSLDQNSIFSEEVVMSAVGDLPLSAASEGVYAAGLEWKVLLEATSFSTNSNILSAGIGGDPAGSKLGMAVYVPGAGCAYGLAQGSSVNSWSVFKAPVELCSGEVALAGPDSGITAPPAPGGLSLSMGECDNGEEGVVIDWEGSAFAEVFVNGESLGSFGPGSCLPGVTLDDVITVNTPGGTVVTPPDEENPEEPGEEENESTIGGVLAGDVIAIRWDTELTKDTANLVVTRDGVPLAGPFEGGVYYDTPGQPGEYVYKVEGNYGGTSTSYPSGVTKINKPTLGTGSGAATNAATRGNTIRVQWGAVPNTETAPLSGYRVYHALSSTATNWEMLRDVSVPVENTYYDHAQLSLGYHCYYVIAYGPGGDSDRSEISCAKVEILPAPSGMAMSDISSAAGHTCGISDAQAYCWGDYRDGRLGIVGASSTATVHRPALVTTEGTLMAGKSVTDIAAARVSTCAIASGEVFCWGTGAVAGGTSSTPIKVNVDAVPASDRASFTSVSSSTSHTCAVSNGNAYCWGEWGSGRLGNGLAVSSAAASLVTNTGVLSGKSVTEVAAGTSHTCAIASGSVYCWGAGTAGQLGDGAFTSQARVPVKVVNGSNGFVNENIVSVSAGNAQSCAANATGQVYCWGTGGKLGNSAFTANTNTPVPVSTTGALSGRKVIELQAGAGSTGNATCAVTEDGKGVCWEVTPSVIDFPSVDASNSVNTISTSGATSCAVTGDGAYCWGTGTLGQLGTGTLGSSVTPTPVNP